MLHTLLETLRAATLRVLQRGVTQAQAVAFNLFLAFFPALLLAAGVLAAAERGPVALEEMIIRLRMLLPPGSRQMVLDFLGGRVEEPWKWILLGSLGTLLVGTQVMTSLVRGFRLLHGEKQSKPFWFEQFRALVLLLLMMGPWIGAMVFTVFGKQVRGWMIEHYGLPTLFNVLWVVVYLGLALLVATLVLAVVYRVSLASARRWEDVLPGAAVATAMWWLVNTVFGFYVREVPYSILYGGVAAAIGLMIWMYLSIMVVFIGAAFNAMRLLRLAAAAKSVNVVQNTLFVSEEQTPGGTGADTDSGE